MASTPETPLPAPEVDQRGLWGVRIAAAASMLLIALPFFEPLLHVSDSCPPLHHHHEPWFLYPGMLVFPLVPYGHVLGSLRSPRKSKQGLGLAMGWAVIVFVGVVVLMAVGELISWLLLLLLATQLILLLSASHASRTARGDTRAQKSLAVGVGMAGGYLVFVLVFGFVLAPTRTPPNPMSINDATAAQSLRGIITAQVTYTTIYPEQGYASSLADLRPPLEEEGGPTHKAADLIDARLASGEKSGYTFMLFPGARDDSGPVTSYMISARPTHRPRTGCRSFFTDESGVIRYTNEDRPATADDPTY
jgi:hypothetical protein